MYQPSTTRYLEFTDIVVKAEGLQKNNYVSVAIAIAVMYDYILTFPDEREYIWNRRWSFVSFLFVLVRYLGCCCALLSPFYRGNTLVSAETCVSASCFCVRSLQCSGRCYALYTLTQFAFLLFLAAADMMMILRVWAMYNGSKFILGILLMVYIPEIILTTVVAGISSTPENTVVVTVLNRSFCRSSLAIYDWIEDALIPFIPAAVTCMLATIRFVRLFLRMRRDTKRWKLDRYTNLLSRESVLYFLMILLFGVINVHKPSTSLANQTWYGFLSAVSCVPLFTLTPRFILSLRALYAREPQNTTGCGIDTGFGFSESLADWDPRGTTMIFADVERDEEAQVDDEKRMEDEQDVWSVRDEI